MAPRAPRPARRRTILKVIALLLAWGAAGAALNVAVAWGLAAWSSSKGKYVVNNANWPVALPHAVVLDLHPIWGVSGRGVREQYAGIQGGQTLSLLMTGWPCHSIFSQRVGPFEKPGNGEPTQFSEGIVIPATLSEMYRYRCFPTQPLWPGFAINTVFYAGVLWVLFCGPFALRRMIRRRRGQCAHCAYPIGQNQRCTECGADVAQRAGAP